MTEYRKKLIEVALPLDAINAASAREAYIYKGNPSSIHKWWAQRPLASCRAVLFAQLVDDPSSWPDIYRGDTEQSVERQRLFGIIEDLVVWENSSSEAVLNTARLEIARSVARNRIADGSCDNSDHQILAEEVAPARVNAYLAEVAPAIYDPFAGGASIPLEAQRLGLRAIASDLNPVAVLINKALIEIPPLFSGMAPVNPVSKKKRSLRTWTSAEGLVEDVRYYGDWMQREATKRIGHLFPPARVTKTLAKDRPDLAAYVEKECPVVAWLWARTVASPNPAMGGAHVPLMSGFWLSKKSKKEVWVEIVVERSKRAWQVKIHAGSPSNTKAVSAGTKTGRGAFRCVLSGDPITTSYIQQEGRGGRLGSRLFAVVALGRRGRIYLPPTSEHEQAANVDEPSWTPDFAFARNSRHMTPWAYGLDTFAKLFTPRQLTALVTLRDLVAEVRTQVQAAVVDGREGEIQGERTEAGVTYPDAVALYLALAADKVAEYSNSLVLWYAKEDRPKGLFARNALPMVWDFAETNPLGEIGGTLTRSVDIVADAIPCLPNIAMGIATQKSAATKWDIASAVLSTDPPYYDNVPYADLSDFFYVWLRGALTDAFPGLFRTVLVPKADELVAEPFRHGSKRDAERFFESGMTEAIRRMEEGIPDGFPATIYYAFKQAEKEGEGTSSTGWETFLAALLEAGFTIVGTWPVRTERGGRMRDIGSNALATSVVLVCRRRQVAATAITRSDFRRLLRQELPKALKALQKGNIAPVDMAQASIGPGMAIFSRHSKVMEADGSVMTVRTALQLINAALDEYLAEQAGEFGADTRFAVTWFETRGFETGPFGEAETLAKARNVSVQGVVEAGIVHSAAGKVRLLKRDELPDDWEPETDGRLTIWECTQHLIKRLEGQGEDVAADLLSRLGERADPSRDLAYRLYQTCERKGWAEEARAYNGLVVAWPELARLAAQKAATAPSQGELF